jgi:DNA-binding beta-propeller fold protein YncE
MTRRDSKARLRGIVGCLAAVALLAAGASWSETLLVVRKTDNALDLVDPGSGLALATVELGFAPHEVSVSPDGRLAAVSNYGTRERPGSTLSVIDLETAREIRRIDLSPHTRPHGVSWHAPGQIAVTAEGSKSLLLVDPDPGRVRVAIETGQQVSHMVAVDAAGTRAYVANIGSGTTTVLDLESGRKLEDLPTGEGSEAIALTPDGRQLWVGARSAGHISIVDTGSLEIVDRIPVAGVPIRIAITADGRTALVSCAASSELVAFDIASRKERARRKVDVPLAADAAERPFAGLAPGSALPVGLTLAGNGSSVYVAATMADRIVQYDLVRLDPIRVIEVAGEPDGMATTAVMPRAPCHGCDSPN